MVETCDLDASSQDLAKKISSGSPAAVLLQAEEDPEAAGQKCELILLSDVAENDSGHPANHQDDFPHLRHQLGKAVPCSGLQPRRPPLTSVSGGADPWWLLVVIEVLCVCIKLS